MPSYIEQYGILIKCLALNTMFSARTCGVHIDEAFDKVVNDVALEFPPDFDKSSKLKIRTLKYIYVHNLY